MLTPIPMYEALYDNHRANASASIYEVCAVTTRSLTLTLTLMSAPARCYVTLMSAPERCYVWCTARGGRSHTFLQFYVYLQHY